MQPRPVSPPLNLRLTGLRTVSFFPRQVSRGIRSSNVPLFYSRHIGFSPSWGLTLGGGVFRKLFLFWGSVSFKAATTAQANLLSCFSPGESLLLNTFCATSISWDKFIPWNPSNF